MNLNCRTFPMIAGELRAMLVVGLGLILHVSGVVQAQSHSSSSGNGAAKGVFRPLLRPSLDRDEATFSSAGMADEVVVLPDVLTLDAARERALADNPDVLAALARIDAAAAQLDATKSAYFPTVAWVHNSSRTFMVPASSNRFLNPFVPQSPLTQTPQSTNLATDLLIQTLQRLPLFGNQGTASGSTRSFSQHASSFAMTWTLFDGFVREARVLAAEHLQRGAENSGADVRRLLGQAVETAYYQAQLAAEQIRVAQADETFNHEQLQSARKRLEVGKIREDEVQSLEVRVTAARIDVIAARGFREKSLTLLAELLALPEARFPEGVELAPLEEESPETLGDQDADLWIAVAQERRPDLQSLQDQCKSAQANFKAARGQFLPSVNFSGSWGYDRISTLHYENEDQSSALALEVKYPIYTGGLRTAQVRQALAGQREAEARLQRQRLAVSAEVRTAVIDLRNAQEQIALQRQNLALADNVRQLVAKEYAVGKVLLERLDDAQRYYMVTDAALAQARINLRQAWTNLQAAACGELVPVMSTTQ